MCDCIHSEVCAKKERGESCDSCENYLSAVEIAICRKAKISLDVLHSRCTPEAEEAYRSYSWGRLKIVPNK